MFPSVLSVDGGIRPYLVESQQHKRLPRRLEELGFVRLPLGGDDPHSNGRVLHRGAHSLAEDSAEGRADRRAQFGRPNRWLLWNGAGRKTRNDLR